MKNHQSSITQSPRKSQSPNPSDQRGNGNGVLDFGSRLVIGDCVIGDSRRGFTTIELLIVLAIFVLSVATTLPFLGVFREVETLSSISEDAVQTLRRAQARAMTGERERQWGVRFEDGRFVLFGGPSYEGRLAALDEVHNIPDAYAFSGLPEITFLSLRGTPREHGIVTVLHPEGGEKTIAVNAAGGIFLY